MHQRMDQWVPPVPGETRTTIVGVVTGGALEVTASTRPVAGGRRRASSSALAHRHQNAARAAPVVIRVSPDRCTPRKD